MALAQAVEPLRAPLAAVDLGLSAVRFIQRHPASLLGGAVLFSVVGAGRVGRWLRRAWVAWQLVGGFRRL